MKRSFLALVLVIAAIISAVCIFQCGDKNSCDGSCASQDKCVNLGNDKTPATMNQSTAKKSLEAPFIRNVEQLSNDEIRAVLNDKVKPIAIDYHNWSDKFPYAPKVEFRIAHSDDAIVIMFDVEEEHVKAIAMENHGRVWEDSCVEFFVGNPNGEGYFNFEINCIGTILASAHKSRAESKPFTAEQLAKVRRFGTFKHEAIDIKGQTKWWLAEVIPFELIGLDKAPKSLKANFYKCGDKLDKAHYMSWSPITLPEPNFHCPEFFGNVELM